LALCENYDPTVQKDMENAFNRLVPEGKGLYQHDSEGPDDMPAHVKSVLSGASINIPITNGQLALGTWQGIWLM
jgi:secondary thiamine-phosphate synthase enzyme